MFIGRNNEIAFLNKCYNSANAEFVVLYGRRRIGKTETISEFCKNKPSLFFSCKECIDSIQLRSFSSALLNLNLPHKQYIDSFKDWDTAFSALGDIEGEGKQVIIIDEFPYMCKNNTSIPSILQNLWDHKLKNSNIMLVVCGSSMSFIENEILSSKNPLYGRATGIYKMLPMPYDDAVKFFPNYTNEDKLIAYAILGGIPHYLKQFDNNLTLEGNIKSKILTKGSILYNEVEFLLRQELRETSVYNTIIEAIALGNSILNDIYNKTQIEKTKLSVYIKNLMDLGIVEKQFPVLSKTKAQIGASRGIYSLTDNFFCFWYAYAYSNFSSLEDGDVDDVWEYNICDNLHHFASRTFENVAIKYLKNLNRKRELPFHFTQIGRQWGKITLQNSNGQKTTMQQEIDILATDNDKKYYIFGECKLTNEPFDLAQFKALEAKNSYGSNCYYYLFSLNGFTEALINYAKLANNVVLISLNDMMI